MNGVLSCETLFKFIDISARRTRLEKVKNTSFSKPKFNFIATFINVIYFLNNMEN